MNKDEAVEMIAKRLRVDKLWPPNESQTRGDAEVQNSQLQMNTNEMEG